MNKPAVVIRGRVSTSTNDELDKTLAFREMWECCEQLNGRRCPVERKCEQFYLNLIITPRNYSRRVAEFEKIKRERDAKFKWNGH